MLQSYRVEDFIDPPAPLPDGSLPALAPTGGTNLAWRVGINSAVPIGTDILMTDRPEGIPRRVQVLLQDDETAQTRAQLEAIAAGPIRQFGDLDAFDVTIPVPGGLKYFKERVTIENRTLGARWSADIQRGQSGVIKGIIAAADDELLIARNVTTYGVVSLFGYGVGVYDLNAVESNDMGEGRQGYVGLSERVLLTAAKGDPRTDVVYPDTPGCDPALPPGALCMCNPAFAAPMGASCEIRDLQFSPDALLFPAATSSAEFIVYALDQRRGLLDMHVVPPQVTDPGPPPVIAPAQTTMAHGLVLAESFTAASGAGILYHPRLRSLRNLYVANASSSGVPPAARFTSVSPYLRTDSGGNAENYALIAGNSFGLLVVKIDGNQLRDDALVGLVWIPAGALSVRVIPRSDLALVVDNAGRVLLIDLRNINEISKVPALPSCTNELCVAELFPTAKKSIAAQTPPLPSGADWIEVGVDDPRIIWKSAPKTVIGNMPPMIDPDTGILISGDLNGNRVAAIAAIDPRVQFRIRTDNGPKFVRSIVPLGIAPKDPFTGPDSSYGAFRIQLTLPGSLTESLTSGNRTLRLAVESERVLGAVTEQTPVPLPPAHLRKATRNGTADPRAPSFSDFLMQRSVPYDPSDPQRKLLRYQRAYNRFLSPWIVALADPRASESYRWGNTDPATQGCLSCKRPASLQGRRAPEVFEMITRGRIISVRSETDLFTNTPYAYLGDKDRLLTRVATTMSDTVRPPAVAVAAQNPPVAGGSVQETTYLHSGEVETAAVDLDAGGRNGFDVVMSRAYRSRSIGLGFLGTSWDSPLFKRLRELPNGTVEYRDGAGDVWEFKPTSGTTYQASKGVFLTLAATDQGWDLSDQRKRISKFDKLGRITRDVDEYFDEASGAGNSIRYLYDNSGRLTTIVDPVGRVTTLDYYTTPEADGLLQSVNDWRQRKLEYKYDNNRRLTDAQLADVTNSDGSRPTTRYAYMGTSAAYNDRIELDKELKSITDPHEVASSGPARVTFDYETSGDPRDHVKSQTWGSGETATFTYNGTSEVTVTDALRQNRVYTITGTGTAAHVTTMIEKQVMTASAPFGELPRSVVPGRVDATPQDRTWSFTYDPEGMLSTSDLNGIIQTQNGFGTVGSAPGEVLRTSTTTGAGPTADPISRTYNYAGSTGAFLQSVQTSGSGSSITMNVPEPTRENVTRANAPALDSTNDSITSSTNYDRAGRPTGSKSSGGTVPGGGFNAQYTYKPDNSSQQFERGEIASVTESSLSTTYQYNTADQTTVTDPRTVTTTTDYDAWRRPTKIVRSGQPGSLEQFEYDATGRLHQHHERQSGDTITTTYEYDVMGRQRSVTRDHIDVGGSQTSVTTRFDYDVPNRKQTTFLPGGGSVVREVDGLGRVTREVTTTGLGPIENRYAYDIAGNRVYSTDMKVATASAFDVHGREILTLNADGTKTTRSFDAGGRPKSVATTSPSGTPVEKSAFTFSDSGRMQSAETSVNGSSSRTTQIGWDGAGRTTAVNVAGRGMLQEFDSAGLLLSSKTGEGSLTSITNVYTDQTYSSHTGTLPQEITTKEKSGATYSTQRTYDDNANVSRENVGGLEWKQQFDEAGNVTSASQPRRPPATYSYDSRGAVTNETKPDGATNAYAYDATGALKRYTDPAAERTTDELDLLGRPSKRIYPDGTIELFTYEGARLAAYTDRQGRIQNFTYNDRGQLTRIDRNGSPQLDQLDYDDSGRLTAWTNKDSTITWEEFNLDGRPAKTTLTVYKNGTGFGARQVAGVFEQDHKWDEHGERTEWTMPHSRNFTSTLPWTDRVRETRDAKGNVIAVERSLFTGGGFTSLMTADFRNAARPNQRTVTTSCGSVACRPASLVRSYDYDSSSGLLDEMSVSSGPIVVAGSRITGFDGTQIQEAQILGVSGGAHAQQWSYDSRSRLTTTTNGRASTQNLSPADFRAGVERERRLDPATRAQLLAKGINVDRIDPPSQTAGEVTGHKVGNVVEGASVRAFTYNGSERNDDGKFRYEFDEKGRLTRATQNNGQMRVTYTYDGDDRMITRLVESGRAGVWSVATPDLLTDGIPAEAIFAWDPITDRLAAVFDATTGAIARQILHGGLGYDDPIEVTLTEPTDSSKINRLYPIYDEAAAGHLQAVLNANGEMVSRKVVADAYGDDSFSIAGAGIDLVQIAATTDGSGVPSQFDVTLRSTEELVASTVPTGVRLAAVDASGNVLRTSAVPPSLTNANTATFTLTPSQWATLTASAAAVSIAVTKDLRASAWGADLPLLPAPEWATATRPVFTSATTPIEIRESLASLAPWLTSIGPNTTKSNTLYEVTDLALMGSDDVTDDPARFLVASPFHALPFFDSVTRLTQVRARWLDHSTGTFLTADPMGYRDSSNLYGYCAGDPVNGRDPSGRLTIVIHGTGAEGDPDFMPGGKFFEHVKATLRDRTTVSFQWSGADNHQARREAAARLVAHIKAYQFAPGEQLNIIGHSHGGNVAIWAINEGLGHNEGIGRQVDHLVLLGTPVRRGYLVIRPWDAPNIVMVNNRYDEVQIRGGGNFVESGEYGPAGRNYPGATNLGWNKDKGPIGSHSVLHTPRVWDFAMPRLTIQPWRGAPSMASSVIWR